jgi:hypothetical protein
MFLTVADGFRFGCGLLLAGALAIVILAALSPLFIQGLAALGAALGVQLPLPGR